MPFFMSKENGTFWPKVRENKIVILFLSKFRYHHPWNSVAREAQCWVRGAVKAMREGSTVKHLTV